MAPRPVAPTTFAVFRGHQLCIRSGRRHDPHRFATSVSHCLDRHIVSLQSLRGIQLQSLGWRSAGNQESGTQHTSHRGKMNLVDHAAMISLLDTQFADCQLA
ncbi:MAG: hypothetical protein DMG96_17100 [Acidobacteria bacterium]|nr:MAG: hypothetical protein DMG96_17100 [Acidobacteriota bacterium]